MTGARAGDLRVIDLDHDLTGYRQFLSCWLYRDDRVAFVVDPGPMSSIRHLLTSLADLGVTKLDYILLTHIHLDHAGATAELLRVYPQARVVCHERGTAHILEPSKLWQGSIAVLGDVAHAYGAPPPVPPESIADPTAVARDQIRVIPTPGHAVHHLAFAYGDLLFSGEMAGTRHPLPGGDYMRPATPPKFILEVALESIDRVLALQPAPGRMVFAHYGIVADPALYLRGAREQLVLWTDIVRALHAENPADFRASAHARLLERDPWYAAFTRLDPDLQAREYHYMGQSLDGMRGYVTSGS